MLEDDVLYNEEKERNKAVKLIGSEAAALNFVR